MKPTHRERFRISEEAAQWLIRLEQDSSAECQAEFTAWSRQSPQHVEEFLFATATWQHLQPIDPERRIDLALLDAPGDAGTVVPIGQRAPVEYQTASLPRSRMWKLAATGFGIMLAIAALYLFLGSQGNRTYATATGDQMTVKLPDGSVLHLNTHSRAKVHFDEHVRDVQLLEGEALFVVERDASRPFQVITDTATIQAIGTQFNVYRREDGTRVSVVDGAVRVTSEQIPSDRPLNLAAGDEASVTPGKVVKFAKPNVSRAVAWRARRLVFQSDRLGDVAREFNRYETRHPLRLEGAEIADRVVSGVFDADDPRPLVEFLQQDPQLSVTESEREIVIRQR